MATVARIASRIAATAAAFATGIALAPAASAQTWKQSLDVAGLFSDEVITGRLLLDDTVARVVDLNAITQTVDALGKAIGSPQAVALRTGGGNSKVGAYSCLPKTNGNADFHQYQPTEIFRSDDKGKVQGLFHVYRQDNARALRTGGTPYQSVQYEVCGIGGSDPDARTRTRRAGIGITFRSAAATYKIAQAWQEGETPSNYTMDMAFKVAHKGVEIGGGISQTPTNKLLGSISTPFAAEDVDMYARNAVNAWWQDGCVGSWKGCQWFNGSKDFHGAVAHGLFEFTPEQSKVVAHEGFLISTFRSTN